RERRLVESRRIGDVVDEWSFQCDLPAAVACGRGERGEVAGQHRRRWNKRERWVSIRAGLGALITHEKEQVVFGDGPAERAAVLIAFQRVARGGKEIPGVELIIADKFKEVAVEFIGAGLRDGADPAARSASAAGGAHSAGFDFEFL